MGKLRFTLLFILPFQLYAQTPVGARYTAMAGPSAALTGLDALAGNPAGITTLSNIAASLSLENEWQSAPIRSNAFLVVPSVIAHIGLSGALYDTGDSLSELQWALAFGRQTNDRLSIGIRLSYRQLSFSGLGDSMSQLAADFGIQYQLRSNWRWGLEVVKPLVLARNNGGESPQFKFGTRFSFSPQTLVALQAAYSVGSDADFALGLEYGVLPWLLVRGGVSVNPFMHHGGLGVLINRFKADGALRIHPQLGLSPQMTLGYAF